VKALFKKAGFNQIELVAAGGGVFEVMINGELRYSKKAIGRFPSEEEIAAMAG